MLNLSFGSSVGKKFNEDGTVRRFPGNTMICILDHATEVFRRAKAERDLIVSSPIASCISPLPDESLHMTAIEGVCDQVRRTELWTNKLPLDAPLVEVDDLFEAIWKGLPKLGEVRMTFDHLWVESGICIALHPATDADDIRIRTWRNTVGEAMGLRFPGHDGYMFHISLAYGIRMPDSGQYELLESMKKEFDTECQRHDFTFTVPEPSLTFFNDMFFFNTQRIART